MKHTAKAAVMTAAGKDLEIIEYPLPAVAPGCILVRVTCCTICGSDVHSWMGRRSAPTPMILGHEIVGKIVELGAGVTHDTGDRQLQVGDRITWTIMDNCGKCYFCREKGLMMKCRSLKKYGHDSCADSPHFVGGFAEYCYITPGTCVVKIPDHLTDEEVAPANCALATVVAGWEAADVKPFENVLIQGAGALGFYAAALARHYGCRRIIVTDILDHRLEFIRAFGATDAVNVARMSEEDVVRTVRGLTGFGQPQAVVDVFQGYPVGNDVFEWKCFMGCCQQVNCGLQMNGIIVVNTFEREPAPYDIAGIIGEVGARRRVADFNQAAAGSQAL